MDYFQAVDKKYMARWRAFDEGECVGYLDVWVHSNTPSMIAEISVRPSHRRQGIATNLLRLAKRRFPDLRHSPDRTEMGDAWAQSTGDELPDPEGKLWPPTPEELDNDEWDRFYRISYYIIPSAMSRVLLDSDW